MFFIKPMEHTILLHPSYFGPNIQRYLRDRLYEDIEGKSTGDFYIIAIMDINDYSEGQVMPGSGFAQYNVHYRAIVWKPFKGEVLDGIVTKVVPNGFFVDIAAFTAFVSAHSMPTNMKYDGNATPPSFVEHTDQGPVEVAPQSQVRLRLSGIRAEVGQMWAVATINDDYLGPLPDEDEA